MARAIRSFYAVPRQLIYWRHAVDANNDARMVFKAASEGRPMELAKRLRLGKLAGGLSMKGAITLNDGSIVMLTPLGATMLHSHSECARVLEDTIKADGAVPVPDGWTALPLQSGGAVHRRSDGFITESKPVRPFLGSMMLQESLPKGWIAYLNPRGEAVYERADGRATKARPREPSLGQ